MDATEREHRLRDAARAAALLLDAVEGTPDAQITTVETTFGSADVMIDDQGADVVLHDRDATVHVRADPSTTAPA